MDKDEFVSSFADSSKISLMNTILGEVYDKAQANINDPVRIIKEHIEGVVNEASKDSRLIDVFLHDRIIYLTNKFEQVNQRTLLSELQTLAWETMLKIKPKTGEEL